MANVFQASSLNGGADRAEKYTASVLTFFFLVSYARVLEVIQDQADKQATWVAL